MEGYKKRMGSCISIDSATSAESDLNGDSGVFDIGNMSPLSSDFRSAGSPAHFEVHARNEFNKHRKIIIKNVPPVTYEEVKEFLSGYTVSNISISKKSRHAIVTLVNGAEAEEIAAIFDDTDLLGMSVKVEIHPNENLLCVAHLPLNMNGEEFKKFLEPYGALERCFLMHSQYGTSKGYGYVEFAHNKEKSIQVQGLLNGQKLGSCTIHCDFVHESIVSFEQLDSLCLLVDHLPHNYSNEAEFKEIFSETITPEFCKVMMNGEQSLRSGVLAFNTAKDAEVVQRSTHGKQIGGHKIRVTFCAPGFTPNEICERLASNSLAHGHSLLPNPDEQPKKTNSAHIPSLLSLPLPSPPNVANSGLANPAMHNLLSQNPQVLEKFQSVLQQLQSQVWNQQQMPCGKPGILGMAPNNVANPLANPNLQIAILAVLLASQAQQNPSGLFDSPLLLQMAREQLLRPSLMGNPLINQANLMLQNLHSQGGKIPNLCPNQGGNQNRGPSPSSVNGSNNSGAHPLLSLPGSTGADLQRLLGILQGGNNVPKPPPQHTGGQGMEPPSRPRMPGVGLLGDAPHARKPGLLGNHPNQHNMPPPMNTKPGLLGSAPGMPSFSSGGPPPKEPRPVAGTCPAQSQGPDTPRIPSLLSLPLGRAPYVRPNGIPQPNMNGNAREGMNGGANPLLALAIELQIRQQLNSLQNNQTKDGLGQMRTFDGNQNSSGRGQQHPTAPAPKPYARTPGRKPPGVCEGMPPKPSGTSARISDQENIPQAAKQVTQGPIFAIPGLLNPTTAPSVRGEANNEVSLPHSQPSVAPSVTGRRLNDSSNTLKRTASERDSSDMFSTPVAKRTRPLHLLPSPEPSPESDYVGQHSQGLGGHYASSYTKKRKF